MIKAEIEPYLLRFKFAAKTSREVFTVKKTYFLNVYDSEKPEIRGRGEIPVFPTLHRWFVDFRSFESELNEFTAHIEDYIHGKELPKNSAVRFGFESAMADFAHGGSGMYYDKEILKYVSHGIQINGLIWMSDIDGMLFQIENKLREGFKCIKLKIGFYDFANELNLIKEIRKSFPSNALEIRVDANGAFNERNVMNVLNELSLCEVHSIEQPLPADHKFTSLMCRISPVKIALDEDMIERWWSDEQMYEWLNRISPHFIIVKPSLIGGFAMADRWINIADSLNIDWWATSALESNIGLSAITQWLATHRENLDRPHGLGTGEIYENNLDAPIYRNGQRIFIRK